MEKYAKAFLNSASLFDGAIGAAGEVTKSASLIVETDSRAETLSLLHKIADIVDTTGISDRVKELAQGLKNNLYLYYGSLKVSDICKPEETIEDARSLEELLNELNSLVGLENVKAKVNDLIAYQQVQQLRRQSGYRTPKSTLHMAFTGNPGTGKTTVARIVGCIYRHLGLLSKGHFVEVSRTDLIAGYQGQTALKVKRVIEKAKGGVLFIDEAYSITENEHSDSYGRECLTELTKALEDYRADLVVIVAGYTEPMKVFFASNPGLRSRFNTFITFDDYDASELEEILILMCKTDDYRLSDEVRSSIHRYFERIMQEKGKNFANARLVRNIYDDLIMNHARRISQITKPSCEELTIIRDEDFSGLIER